MTNHWAIAVGINQYQFLQPLNFAQQDAQAICECLVGYTGFFPERCVLLTDTSAELSGRSTYPNRENLQEWMKAFSQELIQPDDLVWFYFSGYGVCSQGQDYLIPIDGNPVDIDETSIPIRSLFGLLKRLRTQKVLVLLDINRAQATLSTETVGTQTAALAREFRIPTVLSCRSDQFSHEAPALGHGLFTAALLEGLRSNQCSTLAGLEEFLKGRLPELSDHNGLPIQEPELFVAGPEQLYQSLTPVDWSESEEWTPTTELNPFEVEGEFFDGGLGDFISVEDNGMSASLPTEVLQDFENPQFEPLMGAFAVEEPVPPVKQPNPDTIPPLTQPKVATEPRREPNPPAQPPAQPPVVPPSRAENSDSSIWEKILFGGSALLLILLLGVLFRNWNAFTGGQQTANNGTPTTGVTGSPATNNPSPTADSPKTATVPANVPKKNQSPAAGAKSPQPTPPQSSGEILNQARSFIKPTLASDARRAIDRALLIPPNDPLYAEAQQDIDRWSRNILEIAKKRAAQKEWKSAIAAAQLVPRERPQPYTEAQKNIEQWKKRLPAG